MVLANNLPTTTQILQKIMRQMMVAGIVFIALIVVVAVWLRFSPIIWERDMWYDEAFTGILLKAPFGEMNQMIFDDVHPPLYYWLAKPWSAMFSKRLRPMTPKPTMPISDRCCDCLCFIALPPLWASALPVRQTRYPRTIGVEVFPSGA